MKNLLLTLMFFISAFTINAQDTLYVDLIGNAGFFSFEVDHYQNSPGLNLQGGVRLFSEVTDLYIEILGAYNSQTLTDTNEVVSYAYYNNVNLNIGVFVNQFLSLKFGAMYLLDNNSSNSIAGLVGMQVDYPISSRLNVIANAYMGSNMKRRSPFNFLAFGNLGVSYNIASKIINSQRDENKRRF